MTELAQTTADQQQTPPRQDYQEAKWRLRAEAPWVVFTLGLAAILSLIILFSEDQFAPDTLPHIVTLGFLVIPMIILIAAGDVDLSSGMLAGAVCQIVELHWWIGLKVAILISLMVALGVGLINGLLVGAGRLNGIYVTLGMSYVLYGLILVLHVMMELTLPAPLTAFSRSPLILVLWILLVLGCAALMIFTPLGHRPQAGEREPLPLGRRGRLYNGLSFVFSSLMAWISGVLLLGWAGYAGVASGSHYAEIAITATLLGGTAYCAGTGFVLSGAIALIDIVLLQQVLHLSTPGQNIFLGALMVIMLPITQYYHVAIERLYSSQSKKEADASLGDAPQP